MNPFRMFRLSALPLLALAACAPMGGTAQSPTISIDGERALRDVRVLSADSMEGRKVGTRGGARARAYLLAQLRQIGVEPIGAGYAYPFAFVGRRDSTTYNGVNLVGRITGTRYPDRYIVVSAHYDHVGVGRPVNGDSIYNGADDNASGTAALLEMARWFRAHRPATSMVFALLDAEESGLQGARAFVATPPVPLGSIVLDVNMDMVSHSEKGELYAAGAAQYPFLKPYLDSVAARAPIKLLLGHDRPVPTAEDDWTFQSDQGAFHAAKIPFVYFGVEDHPDYHKPSDSFESITPRLFVGAV